MSAATTETEMRQSKHDDDDDDDDDCGGGQINTDEILSPKPRAASERTEPLSLVSNEWSGVGSEWGEE